MNRSMNSLSFPDVNASVLRLLTTAAAMDGKPLTMAEAGEFSKRCCSDVMVWTRLGVN